jgi:N-methylhydantoinase B/oxoprolinase/acetone carboxylase alpha subunit
LSGGTGRYRGARGVDRETRVAEGRTRDMFTIIT